MIKKSIPFSLSCYGEFDGFSSSRFPEGVRSGRQHGSGHELRRLRYVHPQRDLVQFSLTRVIHVSPRQSHYSVSEEQPTDNKHDEAIVRAIIQMGTSLGLVAIAEGVESESTLARLIDLGCHEGQGLHWAPAMPPGEFLEFFRKCRSMSWMPSERTAAGARAGGR